MDRKEFLRHIWERYLRPALVVAASLFVMYLLYYAAQDITSVLGTASAILLLVAGLVAIYVLKSFLERLWKKVFVRFSGKVQGNLITASKIMVFIGDCILGVIIFRLWQMEWLYASLLIVMILIGKVREVSQTSREQST
ncbi:hypothetical protein OGH69_04410 [Flavobacterium sp. MFBS3-15]|uniref:hypothetical protein n=1 Tax=Flavobacterium sp. MFBS3-15 TaxID=2989816 RepID=UPI0022361EBD|nr:hypothetical protein [Flavobacterium sp. MFBS3-15]MCW4468200.1 hypothetical protein [Flavobacterium sp. MFBS3-15]